jgi:uncharacterized protein (DUF1330 family)
MSVYVIAQIEIHDRDEYKNYIAGFRQMFKGYRGFSHSGATFR